MCFLTTNCLFIIIIFKQAIQDPLYFKGSPLVCVVPHRAAYADAVMLKASHYFDTKGKTAFVLYKVFPCTQIVTYCEEMRKARNAFKTSDD